MTHRPKILIVEDETVVAMMAVYLLTRAGCDVSVANTGKKGIKLAEESRFDLITLDVDLPDISGFEICRELKQRHISRNTPVICVSGQLCEQGREQGLNLGAVDYITKPFDTLNFASRILSHVEQGRGRLSNVPKKQTNRNLCRLGDAQQSFNGNYFFAALNFANIFGVQIRQFRQLFLRKIGALAVKTNGVANNSSMPQDRFPFFLRGWHNP